MKAHRTLPLAAAAALAAAVPLSAKITTSIDLDFVPQQAVAGAEVSVTPEMMGQPVALRVVDGRPGADPYGVGSRTDDDDVPHPLRSNVEVAPFLESALQELAAAWGLSVDAAADRTLEVTVTGFEVQETNQAVGATFRAESRLALALLDGAGNRIASAAASGDASRYGRANSNANCNEVLSDSLLEAFAAGLSQPSLQQGWTAPAAPRPIEASASASATGVDPVAFHIDVVAKPDIGREELVSPEDLLEDLVELIAQGFESETLLDFVDRKALSAPLSADDLANWKESGIPEEVIRAVLSRPVR